jgi:hypothetical protein
LRGHLIGSEALGSQELVNGNIVIFENLLQRLVMVLQLFPSYEQS